MLFLTDPGVVGNPVDLELSFLQIVLRLLCAMIVGLVIGTEREFTHRPAGMRTHILVALGSCAVMITGQLIFAQYKPYGGTADPARLSAQVITGVGFLGAGTILREGANVKGLTTAASLWSVACLGIAAGGGYYAVALAGMVFIFITLTFFEVIQNKLMNGPHSSSRDYVLETGDIASALTLINNTAQECRCQVQCIEAKNLPDGICRVTFHCEFGNGKKKKRQIKFFETLAKSQTVNTVHTQEASVGAK